MCYRDHHSIDTSLWLFLGGVNISKHWEQGVFRFPIRPVMAETRQYVRLTAESQQLG